MLKRLSFLIPFAVLAIAVTFTIYNPPILQTLRFAVFDTFLRQHPRPYNEELPVKIIDIDDESLNRLGQFPWPRTLNAELIDRLTTYGAAAIALDIVFAEPDRTSPEQILPLWEKEGLTTLPDITSMPNHDTIFAESIAESNVVTGFVLNEQLSMKAPALKAGYAILGDDPSAQLDRFTGAVVNLPELEEAAAGNGALNSMPEQDGIIRRMPLAFGMGRNTYPTLMAEVLRIAQGASSYVLKTTGSSGEESYTDKIGILSVKIGDFEIPTDATGKFWIYYTDFSPKRYISAWQVFEEDFDPSLVEGQIILVGTSAAGLKDIRSTPLNPAISGVEVHAQALEQIIEQNFIERPDWMDGIELVSMVVIGITIIILMHLLPFFWSASFTFLSLGGAFWFSWLAFTDYKLLIDPVTPSISIILLYLSESLRQFMMSEQEKKHVRTAFSHYMSPALVEQLAENPDALQLGGEMREMSILFCDIRGFTTISEQFDAEGLTQFINDFLTPMTDIILSQKGTIDKYMGDCIMAFWNAPLDDEDHAFNACHSALLMAKSLEELNQTLKVRAEVNETPYIPVNIGIGINSGECCVGNMGSEQRFDYSVLGDDVNLASRLEGQSKTYGVTTVIGENTQARLIHMATLELDLIMVKGKTEAVKIYALLGDNVLVENEAFQSLTSSHQAMLEAYRNQEWAIAKGYAQDCERFVTELDLGIEELYALYLDRISTYEHAPPPPHWDGVYVALSK